MVGAERRTHGGNGKARLAVVPDERNDFLAQVGIENGLHVAAVKRMRCLVVEAEAVDGIDAVEFDTPGVDEIGECAYHALIFQLPFITGTGGKPEKRRTPVAVNNNAQFETETGRMPAVIFTFHRE